MAQALRAAVQVTDAISGWNAATLTRLPCSRVTMSARALTGDQVSDDATLVTAKLADRRIEVPSIAYRDVREAYEDLSGKVGSREGVLAPVLAAQLERHAGPGWLAIERVRD